MKSILITGCNRGIGLGLVKHLIKMDQPPKNIFATCRDMNKATELTALAEKSNRIHIIEIDLSDVNKYKELAETVSKKLGNDGLNVLINNAGISTKFTRLQYVKFEQLTEAFLVNTAAPILLSKELHPLLKKAANDYEDKSQMNVNRAAIINMTSLLGSIDKNTDGGFYPYRCSKSALNAATKSMSIDLNNDGILVACLHPGWVRTDMGGSNAPMDVDTSVGNILNTLKSLTKNHTGCFLQHDGTTLPW